MEKKIEPYTLGADDDEALAIHRLEKRMVAHVTPKKIEPYTLGADDDEALAIHRLEKRIAAHVTPRINEECDHEWEVRAGTATLNRAASVG